MVVVADETLQLRYVDGYGYDIIVAGLRAMYLFTRMIISATR